MASTAPRPLRVDQLLSRYGYCSRREAALWVRAGRVVRGTEVLEDVEARVRPAEVRVDGEVIEAPDGLVAMLHKPAGVVCSRDEREGPSVFDRLPARWSARNPPVACVGRLDKDTTGLLLVTDVGALVHRWTSPRQHVEKLYEFEVKGELKPEMVALFAAGTLQLEDEDAPCRPARLEILSPTHGRLTLVEGKYHQVKRMLASQRCEVTRLHRAAVGEYTLGDLPVGEWRLLPVPAGL